MGLFSTYPNPQGFAFQASDDFVFLWIETHLNPTAVTLTAFDGYGLGLLPFLTQTGPTTRATKALVKKDRFPAVHVPMVNPISVPWLTANFA
jgi:hypothetical protein